MKKILLLVSILLLGIMVFVIFEKKELHITEKQSFISTKTATSPRTKKTKPAIPVQAIYKSVKTKDKQDKTKTFGDTGIAGKDEQKYYEEEISRREKISYIDQDEEVYQEDNQIFINMDGEHKKISSGKDEYYMPKLSSNKTYLSYEDSNGIIIQNIIDETIIKLGDDASNVSWHPFKDIIVFVRTKDDGALLTASEIYLYDIVHKKEIALTHTKKRIETDPIFSEDGSKIYAKDESTEEILSIDVPSKYKGE